MSVAFSAAVHSDTDDAQLESVGADVDLTAPIGSVDAVSETFNYILHLNVLDNSPFYIEPSTSCPFSLSVLSSEYFQMFHTVRTVLLRFGVTSSCTVLAGSKFYLKSPDTEIPG